MDEEISKYNDLIDLIEKMPKVSVPDYLTQRIMMNCAAKKSLSIWQLLQRTFAEARKISWSRFTNEYAQERHSCFYFLITGFFFFFMGSVLLSSTFFIDYVNRVTGFILLQSLIVLVAAIALLIGGMMMATGTPDNLNWAKRTIIFYEIMMILSAFLIVAIVKTSSGELLALITVISGIFTGILLTKSLENKARENDVTFTGEFHNA